MSKNFLKTSIGLLILAGTIRYAVAAAPNMVRLSGHVPSVVSRLAPVEPLPATNILHLAIGLPVSNQAQLQTLLQQIYDPASTNYHQYLTPAEFASRFGASQQNCQAVISFVEANGLTVTALHSNRLVLDVSGSVANIEQAFNVQLNVYHHPTEARTFFAPTTDPMVGSSLSILHISGLDNYNLPRPRMVPVGQNPNAGAIPQNGSGPGQAYLGADFRKAYVPGSTLTGKGQSVGLLQFDGFYPGDISAYASLIGLTNPPQVITVPIDGGVAVPGGGNGEVCLDIEMIMAMAPGVSNIYVYEAPNPSPWVDLLSRMANDNLAKQLSCSWGGGPQDPTAEQIFQQMALQGQSFYNAVGDSCAFVPGVNPVQFPEDSPNITQVGGTTLTTGTGVAYASEQVWNWGYPNPNGGYWGSCGGISTYYAIPSWQQGLSMTNNHGSTTMRNMPDVALTADNVYVTYDGGSAGAFGGTSCAAPLWAAFTALINEQGAINGRPSVGFINPAIYNLAQTASYTNYFHDVTLGDNTWPGSPTNFFAVPGYDLCTGLGTPNGTNLINALVGITNASAVPIIPAPKGPWGTNLAVMSGTDPNGPWFLFVQDDQAINSGMISNGWYLTLTTANPFGNEADNQLYMTPLSQSITLGNPWSCVLSVTNYGPADARNVQVTDTLPSGLPSSPTTQASVGSVSQVGSTLIWNVGSLSVGSGAVLSLTFQPDATGIYTNSAVVASDADPNPDDDLAGASLTVNLATPPVLSSVGLAGGGSGGFQFTVSGSAGNAVVEASTNLVNWIPIYTNLIPFTFTNTDSANFPIRFYRVVQ